MKNRDLLRDTVSIQRVCNGYILHSSDKRDCTNEQYIFADLTDLKIFLEKEFKI